MDFDTQAGLIYSTLSDNEKDPELQAETGNKKIN